MPHEEKLHAPGFDFSRRGSSTSTQSKKSQKSQKSLFDKQSPGPPAPSIQQIDIVRYSWERLCERRHAHDDASVSAAHAFGLCFFDALFGLEPALKLRFINVLAQARAMAGIIAFLTRSPSVKGEQGSIRDMNAQSRLQYRKQQQQQQPPRRGGVPMKRSAPVKNRLDKKNKDQGMDDDDFDENAMDDKESFVSLVQTASGKKRNAVCPFHHTGPPAITTTASTPTPTTIPAAATPPKPKSTVSTATNKPTSLKMQVEMDVMLKQQQDHDDENRWYADKLYELGASHIDYDLLPHHLDLAAPALLSALRRRLNDECVPEVEEAWDHVLLFTCHHMKQGMEAALSKQMRKDHRMSTMSSDSLEMDETRGQCMIQ